METKIKFLSDVGAKLKATAETLETLPDLRPIETRTEARRLSFALLDLMQKLGEIEVGYLTRLVELGDDEARKELIRRNGGVWLSVKTPSVGSLLDAAEMALSIYEFNEDTLNGDEQDAYEALDREVRKFRPDYDSPDA